jgi:hypothetical protein
MSEIENTIIIEEVKEEILVEEDQLNVSTNRQNDLACENDDDIIIEESIVKRIELGFCDNRVSLNLKDFNMFEVRTSTYSKSIVDICRNIRGREYNPQSKVWLLPLPEYKNVLSSIRKVPLVNIVKELTKEEISKIQIIIAGDFDDHILIQTIYNDDLNIILKNYCGVFSKEKYGWRISNLYKEDFLARMKNLKIEIVRLADKPKGLYIFYIYIYFDINNLNFFIFSYF